MQYMALQRYLLYELLLGLSKSLPKPKGFLMFSGGIEKQQRAVMG